VTPKQLRRLVDRQPDFAAAAQAYHRLYALPAEDEAVTLSALQRYTLLVADQRAQRQQATDNLVAQLLKQK